MAASARPTIGNLTAEQTSFIGRRREVADLVRLLAGVRLVTLTGVGGVGKTRLARRAAAQARVRSHHGVWFVDLAAVSCQPWSTGQASGPQLVARQIAAALGVREVSPRPHLQLLTDYLAHRRLLLVLDSCEHLVDHVAEVAHALLQGCRSVRILATSREPLGVTGESLFMVEPLPMPDPHRLPAALEQLMECDSVALFADRARQARPDFRLTAANWEAVAAICHRLEGVPLAIELAAARVQMLSPQQVLDRLADRFAQLGPADPDAPDRQQTLHACIDWSFRLCTGPEQLLWSRLTVFADSFELDAVEAVCADQALPTAAVLDLVADLVNKSILACNYRSEHLRYRMLDVVRDFGRNRLRESGQETAIRRRHCDWYQQLVVRAKVEWISARQTYWLDRLIREHPNLSTAIDYALAEPGRAEAALRLAVTLPMLYWWARGLFSEGRQWIDRALTQATEPTSIRARAMLLNGYLAVCQGDVAAGMRLVERGEAFVGPLDDPVNRAYARYVRGTITGIQNDLPAAVESLEDALTILSQLPGPELEMRLGILMSLGIYAGLSGDSQRAHDCYQEIMAITVPRRGISYRSYALWALGIEGWHRGNLDDAAEHVTASLRIQRPRLSIDRYGIALCLEALAWIAASRRQHGRAATLLGAAAAMWTDIGTSISAHGHLTHYHETCEWQARDNLGETAYTDAFRYGSALTDDDALTYALEQRPPAPRYSSADPQAGRHGVGI
jgi:predicted ATPase